MPTQPQKPTLGPTSLSDWDRIFAEQQASLRRLTAGLAALEKQGAKLTAAFAKEPDTTTNPEQDRAEALAGCIRALEEMDFTTDDLDFILVLLTMLWGRQPAALFAQLLALRGADRPLPESPASQPSEHPLAGLSVYMPRQPDGSGGETIYHPFQHPSHTPDAPSSESRKSPESDPPASQTNQTPDE